MQQASPICDAPFYQTAVMLYHVTRAETLSQGCQVVSKVKLPLQSHVRKVAHGNLFCHELLICCLQIAV